MERPQNEDSKNSSLSNPSASPQSVGPTSKGKKIIESIPMLIVAVATIGPMALPLLWRNPRFSRATKLIWTVVIILFTVALMKFGKDVLESTLHEMEAALNKQ